MTQHEQILDYLSQHENLSPGEALNKLGIYALSQRCGELNKETPGTIGTRWDEVKGHDGKVSRFKRYFLESRARQAELFSNI